MNIYMPGGGFPYLRFRKEAKLVCGLISREHRFGLGPSRIVRVVWESACLQNRGVVGRDTVCSWS